MKVYEKIRNKTVRQFCDEQRGKWKLPPGLKASAVTLSGHDYTQYSSWHEPHEGGWLLCSALQGSKAVIQRRFWEEMVVEAWKQFGDDAVPPSILDLQDKLADLVSARVGGHNIQVVDPIPFMLAKVDQAIEEAAKNMADLRNQRTLLETLQKGTAAMFSS